MIFKTKVWAAIAVCLFVLPLMASLAQDTGSGEATPEATVEATTEATPEATPDIEVTVEPGFGIIIIIEGPVEEVNINIITIFDIDVEVDEDDPILTVIQIGDVLRISGELLDDDDDDDDDDNHIRLVAITIIFINVDVIVVDGQVWRDHGNCDNAPPPWAPAHGWHRRCDRPVVTGGGGTTIIIIGGDGSGSGRGMGMGR